MILEPKVSLQTQTIFNPAKDILGKIFNTLLIGRELQKVLEKQCFLCKIAKYNYP
jgi:hypothetical protein